MNFIVQCAVTLCEPPSVYCSNNRKKKIINTQKHVHVGMELSKKKNKKKANKMQMTLKYFYTIPTSCHLPTMTCVC